MTQNEAREIMLAHQYLYYVLATPVWSDREYDMFCKGHDLDGGGGSDLASSYSPETVKLASQFLKPTR